MTYFIDNLSWLLVVILTMISVDLLFTFLKLRKKSNQLQEEYVKRDLLLNSIAEGVYGLDLNGNCTFCNAATLRLLGYQDEAALVGRNIHDLIHHTHINGSSYSAEECRACLAYRHNQEIHLEDEVFWRSDGTSFQAEYWAYPVHKGKKLIGAVVSFVDISERKETEARIKAANRELDAFVYTVSHDLRVPISAVIGYTEFIKDKHCSELSEDVMDMLDTIEIQGQKMAVLVDDLLALATVGKLDPPDAPVNSNDELTYILTEINEEIERKGVRVVVNELPTISIPNTLLGQIFQNLIINAVRYAGMEDGLIEVGGSRHGKHARFYVRDHGKGVPKEEYGQIFEVFYRGSTGKNLIGSGVGLATVQKIARHYGGKAWVEDTPGGGATFWVEMEA